MVEWRQVAPCWIPVRAAAIASACDITSVHLIDIVTKDFDFDATPLRQVWLGVGMREQRRQLLQLLDR